MASTIIAFAITCLGNVGLSTPYRRIIFGLSIADILQSLALLTGPMSVSSHLSGAAGTEVTSCKVNGFFMSTGANAVILYTFFLCVYYLYKLKYKMSDDAFKNRIEKKFHTFIVVFCLSVNIAALAMDTFHTSGFLRSFCGVNSTPTGCRNNPEIVGECDPIVTKRANIFIFGTNVALPIICFMGIIISMSLLYQHAYVLNKTIEEELKFSIQMRASSNPSSASASLKSGHLSSWRGSSSNTILRTSKNHGGGEEASDPAVEPGDVETQMTTSNHESNPTSMTTRNLVGEESLDVGMVEPVDEEVTETPQDRVQHLSRLYRREMNLQASCYVGAFCFTYIPMIICVFLTIYKEYPVTISAVVVLTFPLGGFLNILVYTRPMIASLRRTNPECSRLRAFWLVLRAGGEIPSANDDLTFSCCWNYSCSYSCNWFPSRWFVSEYYYSDETPITKANIPPPPALNRKVHVSRLDFLNDKKSEA